MDNVAIRKIDEAERGASAVFAEMEKAAEAIRRRAFNYFQERGSIFGKELDDWLRAERELMWSPGAEVTENGKEVVLRVQAPGFEPGNIRVTATPHSILIQGEVSHRHEESNGQVCFCDFAEKLLRRVNLPHEIDVDNVKATLNNGILEIVAAKSQAALKRRPAPVSARANAAA
jgi:HSP20 family protein